MIDSKVIDWFCLINSKGIGPKTFWNLLQKFKTANTALKQIQNPYPRKEAEKILKSLKYEIILASDENFPKLLKRSSSCPPMLYFKGNKDLFSKRKIAIIGARNASITGKSIAKNLASNLSFEFCIVSGLAKGIDTSAHLGSLENKSAIAVLPFGLDNIYPKENLKLYEEISKNGLVISEIPPGINSYEQGMFYARNRIITLLSDAVIVIEAAEKSGTMATAKMALDFGCEIFVVPGSPADPRNIGSNNLIKNGAILIQDYTDVLEHLGRFEKVVKINKFSDNEQVENYNIDDKKEKILSLLSEVPVDFDQLAVHSGIDIKNLLYIISELEMEDRIERYSTNEIALKGV